MAGIQHEPGAVPRRHDRANLAKSLAALAIAVLAGGTDVAAPQPDAHAVQSDRPVVALAKDRPADKIGTLPKTRLDEVLDAIIWIIDP